MPCSSRGSRGAVCATADRCILFMMISGRHGWLHVGCRSTQPMCLPTLHPHPTLPVTSAMSRATDSLCWCWRLVCLLPAGDCHGWPRLHVQPRPGLVSGAWCGQRQSIFGHGELHVAWFCPTQLTAWQPGTSRTGFACHTHATYTPCLCCPLAPCTPDSTAPGWFNPAQTCIPSASLLSPPPASPPVLPHPAATWRSWR